MEPVTHALASLALARAGLNKVTRLATPMLLVAGLAADLDWLGWMAGPRVLLRFHRTATHSLVGSGAIALAVAAGFWCFAQRNSAVPLRFGRALLVCVAGAGTHLLLDLTNSYGVKLLWPFGDGSYAWDLVDSIDPWILVLLLLGLLMPGLFRLVSEEIGARPRPRGLERGAIVALSVLALYIAGRWLLHERALELLRSRLYHARTPQAVGAFPSGTSPLTWAGVVETDNTLNELEVSLAPGSLFDPDLGRTLFKPEPTPALEAARQSPVAREFLQFARFPKATVERTADGYRVELRDLRFASPVPAHSGFTAVIELNSQLQVVHEELNFGPYHRK